MDMVRSRGPTTPKYFLNFGRKFDGERATMERERHLLPQNGEEISPWGCRQPVSSSPPSCCCLSIEVETAGGRFQHGIFGGQVDHHL